MTATGNQCTRNRNPLKPTVKEEQWWEEGFWGGLERMLWIPRMGMSAGLIRSTVQDLDHWEEHGCHSWTSDLLLPLGILLSTCAGWFSLVLHVARSSSPPVFTLHFKCLSNQPWFCGLTPNSRDRDSLCLEQLALPKG
jgi:hypothetical protein